ncbi:WD40 repeat-like protein [Calocera viscosa TUFC12733]|uniref:WD40 repeat-like protein n=1 Tax=Calocera viscosa (strain TUFC12733) TaxID=1330018 RepID=A0A167HMW5_CALVF|nr:WD40 repeat-like protein [Calocera viscosa TUFC12733]
MASDITAEQDYSPASVQAYDPTLPPKLLTTVHCPSSPSFPGNFFRSAHWCPDGSSLLTLSEDHVLRLYPFAPEADYSLSHLPLSPPLAFPSPAPVTSHLWHPFATPSSPAYSFLLAARGQPIHLLSASTGARLASYRIIDHREQFISPLSLAFEPSSLGTRFWAGHSSALESFDLSRPGPGTRFPLAGTRKSRSGQRGLISALAFSPTDADTLACGSYSNTVALYSLSDPREAQAMLSVPGGVTQLTWSPEGGKLMAGFRGKAQGEVWVWDVRMFAEGRHWTLRAPPPPSSSAAAAHPHSGTGTGTQQRLLHSLSPSGRYLLLPTPSGYVHTFDLSLSLSQPSNPYPDPADPADPAEPEPVGGWQAHGDAVGSVQFFPAEGWGLGVTVGGGRHYPDDEEEMPGGEESLGEEGDATGLGGEHAAEEDSSEDSEDSSEASDSHSKSSSTSRSIQILPTPKRPYAQVVRQSRPRPRDSTLKLWKFPEVAAGSG